LPKKMYFQASINLYHYLMNYKVQDHVFDIESFPTQVPRLYADKLDYENKLQDLRKAISEAQSRLFEQPSSGVLVVFQAMDAAGKDGTMQAVFQGVHPLGLSFQTFKRPSETEWRHDFMWRCVKEAPERGHIQVFNRSYYEEVLIVKIHEDKLIPAQGISPELRGEDFWDNRYRAIRHWEDYMANNGFKIIKFFLHVSKQEQGKRLKERLEDSSKHYKFQPGDLDEREFWDQYQKAYELMIQKTATAQNPWFVIPADDKRTMRMLVAEVLQNELQTLVPPRVPTALFSAEQIQLWTTRIDEQNKK